MKRIKLFEQFVNESKDWAGVPVTVEKLKELFDADAMKDILDLEDYAGVSVDGKNGKEYDVRFQDGKYLMDAVVESVSENELRQELKEFADYILTNMSPKKDYKTFDDYKDACFNVAFTQFNIGENDADGKFIEEFCKDNWDHDESNVFYSSFSGNWKGTTNVGDSEVFPTQAEAEKFAGVKYIKPKA